jgi:hypothetical protein
MKKIYLRNIIPLLGIVFFYACSAKSIPSTTNSSSETNSEVETVDLIDKKLNIDSLLNSYNDKISNWKDNEVVNPLDSLYEEISDVVFIGKFINKKDVFALHVIYEEDWNKQKIDFYKFDNGKWNKLISDDYNYDYSYVQFENLNDDEDVEILFFGSGNMNGNRQHTIYKYDESENKFEKLASLFVTELSYDSKTNLVHYQYFGSYYMDQIQAEYKWNNNKLIPVREIRKRLKIRKLSDDKFDAKEIIYYYENPTQEKDTLVLKFKKTYREKNIKLYDLWENFFENK